MRSRMRRSRASLVAMALASVLAIHPGAAHATYTGMQAATTLGTMAADGDWIAVPRYEASSDPGSIDGTPFSHTTSSLEVSRMSGSRYISFKTVTPSSSVTMGPMQAAAAKNVLAVAWTDAAGAGQINTSTLSAGGDIMAPVTQSGIPIPESVRLASGADGAYAVRWTDSTGAHAMAAPTGAPQLTPLLGPDVPLNPADRVVLSGGNSFWLLSNIGGGGLSAAPAVFGQDAAPQAVTVGGAAGATALGDSAGGLWALSRGSRGWLASHIDRSGQLSSTALPAGATSPVIALAGTTAVIAYRTGSRCSAYIERLPPAATPHSPSVRTKLTRRATACWAPKGIAVDPSNGTAFVLMRSSHGTALATEATTRKTSIWSRSLTERVDAVVAVGSSRVVVESSKPRRDIGEQCGGAEPSSSQSYFVRVFRGAHLERTGRLEASVMNC